MGATNHIATYKKHGIEISRGHEAIELYPEDLVLITDPNDPLYDPGVEDEPSPALVQSVRDGKIPAPILVVNRGARAGAPVSVVAEGRSRTKATRIVNAERVAEGKPRVKIACFLIKESEARDAMIKGNVRQRRSPLYEAKRWLQFLKIETGSESPTDEERTTARNRYIELTGYTRGAFAKWETVMQAHPDVLAMCEAKQLSANAIIDLVNLVPYNEQPEKARLLKKGTPSERPSSPGDRHEEPASDPAPQAEPEAKPPSPSFDIGPPSHVPADVPATASKERKRRNEREKREAVLGTSKPKPRCVEEIRALAMALRKSAEDYDSAVAVLLWASGDSTALDAMRELVEDAQKEGWKK